ncbi:type IV toxin-antitoxin system AbiEi family antitoxin [Leisingera caerulea]|uniref:Type IV toxin-antitoxin system AbiEi family antitoxin n=1 Tax=Leisingera caerulea TaxID=506591 RepID=A0ABY5WUQ9_LEICA|nr:type IV toxin-antitoxin system AbiEi family antitoxin [Leisingera caerulea]
MKAQNRKTSNQIAAELPLGALVDSAWLSARGISRKQQSKLEQLGIFRRIAHGIYEKAMPSPTGEKADAYSLLLSLQNLHQAEVHLGGERALSTQGFGHYLQLGAAAPLTVYADHPPTWARRAPVLPPIQWRKANLFQDDLGLTDLSPLQYRIFSPSPKWRLRASVPERATLELLEELPRNTSFHLADTVFEALTNVRPRLMSALLAGCRSVKAKRLFMIYAERHQQAWLKHLSLTAVDFGSGKRALVPGGRLEPKYQITLPEDYVSQEEEPDGPGV